MEEGRRDWQGLTDLGQRFAVVEAALDALSQGSPDRSTSADAHRRASRPGRAATGCSDQDPAARTPAAAATSPQAQAGEQGSGGQASATGATPASAGRTSTATAADRVSAHGSGGGPKVDNSQNGSDPTTDLEAAWLAFETRQELEELKRRVNP